MEENYISVEPDFAATLNVLGVGSEIHRVFGLVKYVPESEAWVPIPGSTDLEVPYVSPLLKTAVLGVREFDGQLIGTLVSFEQLL